MQNYNPVISTPRLENAYFKSLMGFFSIDSLFHSIYSIEFNQESLENFALELQDQFSDENIREFIDREIDSIEVYHANRFNYQFPKDETKFTEEPAFNKSINLLKANQYIYIKHYVEDLTFILLSALTLTLVTGAGSDFLEEYLTGKKDSFTNEIEGFATDTTIKNVNNLTMTKSELMKYDGYIWQTMEDDKVRESHRALNGKHMQWDKPDPNEGHPGTAVNCRCYCRPVPKGSEIIYGK